MMKWYAYTDKEEYEEFVVQQKKELSKQYPEQVVIKSPTNVRLEEEVSLFHLRQLIIKLF